MNAVADDSLHAAFSARQRAEANITLGVLNAIEENSVVTQRTLAKRLGIALGLANAYLRRCVSKGLIKATQAPANRYVYYLTPQGFTEKSRLTAQYLAISFDFFRAARAQCREILTECERQGWGRVVLCGAGDLAEIAVLSAAGGGVKLVGLVEPGAEAGLGVARLPIFADLAFVHEIDAAIITDQKTPQITYDRTVAVMPRSRVLTPGILNISRVPPILAE